MSLKLLALDTATEACSAALWVDGATISRFEVAGRSHTERLQPMVRELMAEGGVGFSDLDGFICGIGPGSFAGVRIGVGFVKGLALATSRPVIGIGSLEMLAQPALDAGAELALACIDARMAEVYAGAYRADPHGLAVTVMADVVAPPEHVHWPQNETGVTHAIGTGWDKWGEVLAVGLDQSPAQIRAQAYPDAALALRLALPRIQAGQWQDAGGLAPAYLRNRVALTLTEQIAARAAKAAGST